MPYSGYTPILNDDGKLDIYDNAKAFEAMKDGFAEHTKKKKEEEDAKSKKIDDAANMFNKFLKPAEKAPTLMWPGGYGRSAEEIRAELAKVNADMEQLCSWAPLMATKVAACEEVDAEEDQLAMCSGALQGNEDKKVQPRGQKQLKSALAGRKKVNFADQVDCKTVSRIEEVADEDDGRHECACCH